MLQSVKCTLCGPKKTRHVYSVPPYEIDHWNCSSPSVFVKQDYRIFDCLDCNTQFADLHVSEDELISGYSSEDFSTMGANEKQIRGFLVSRIAAFESIYQIITKFISGRKVCVTSSI